MFSFDNQVSFHTIRRIQIFQCLFRPLIAPFQIVAVQHVESLKGILRFFR
ncbi:unnamed protein product [Haemonchus placei]|uniref:Uncharacterized protein n=1 Tax=Haemonchus placei TaxID=6290 RepID=A0A3P7YAH4_HAEPC|nr:unnamed protein product [Haemonchus placei]